MKTEEMRENDKERLLFVCLGNICRSPAAEGVMRGIVESDRRLSGRVEVDSAGIGAWHAGQLPDPRMRRCGQDRGYSFQSRARQVTAEDFRRFDLLFGMDRENVADLERLAPTAADRQKIRCLADYLTEHPQYHTVPDPYYGHEPDFRLALDLIEDACREVARRLAENDN